MEQAELFRTPRHVQSPDPPVDRPVPAREMLVAEASAVYLDHLRSRGGKDLTIGAYERELRLLARFAGVAPVGSIGPADLRAFGAWIRARTVNGRSLAEKTISRTITAVRSFFSFLEEEKAIEGNPARKTLLPIDPPSEVERPLGEGEVRQAFAAWSKRPRHYVLGSLLIHAGLDRSEILTLTTGDVDLTNRFRPEVIATRGRAGRPRRVPLPAEFAPAFTTYVKEDAIGEGSKLFGVSERRFTEIVQRMGETGGIRRPVTARVCHNTFLTICIRKGMTDDEICRALGRAPARESRRLAGKIAHLKVLVGG